jgi:hypothetical protein
MPFGTQRLPINIDLSAWHVNDMFFDVVAEVIQAVVDPPSGETTFVPVRTIACTDERTGAFDVHVAVTDVPPTAPPGFAQKMALYAEGDV